MKKTGFFEWLRSFFRKPPPVDDRVFPERHPWYMTHVVHKSCGDQIGWIVLMDDRPVDRVMPEHYMRLDGTHIDESAPFNETCARCGKPVNGFEDMMVVKRMPDRKKRN